MRVFPCLLVAALVGCNRSAPPAPPGGNPADPGPVKAKVATPKRQSLQWVIEQPGTVEPLEITPLVAKLPGYVASIAPDEAAVKAGVKLPGGQEPVIDIGSEVGPNQLLATLDIPELDKEAAEKTAAVELAKAEEKQAEQNREVAAAQVQLAEAGVKEAKAGVVRADADVARWQTELEQVGAQIKSGVADEQTRTLFTRNWRAAEATKAEAEAKVGTADALVKDRTARKGKAEADVVAAAARVRQAEAEAARVESLRGYKKIVTPFPGIVTARNVHPRHFVQPTTGPLFTVARIDVLRVFAEVPEVSMGRAGVGTAVVVRVPSLGGREYPATVTRTPRVVNPESRTLRVEIDVENPDRALAPGTYVVVQIGAAMPDALVVPSGCVMAADETHYVFVVEGGKAVKYRVQLGRSDAGGVQVLGRRKATVTTGPWEKFSGTEQLVNGNLGALADGTPVTAE